MSGLRMKGVTEKRSIALPDMWTNEALPDSRSEVASRKTVAAHKHISHYAKFFPDFDQKAEVFLLIGRDCGPAMATRCYGHKAPFVHHTSIGWALVGEVCLGQGSNKYNTVLRVDVECEHLEAIPCFTEKTSSPRVKNIFNESHDDELLGYSKDDQRFIDIVSESIHLNDKGKSLCPYPSNLILLNFQTTRLWYFIEPATHSLV